MACSGRFDGRLITVLFVNTHIVWPHCKLLDRREPSRNASPKFSYFCCFCYQIRAFGLLHVQDHKFVRSVVKRPRELDSATLKTEATLACETSERSSYTVWGHSEEYMVYQQTFNLDIVLFVLSNGYS